MKSKKNKPFKISLWGGWYGSRNKGDHTILMTVTDLFRRRRPDCEIVVLTKNAAFVNDYMEKSGSPVCAIDKLRQWYKTLWHLTTSNLFVITGGVPFFDKKSHLLFLLLMCILSKVAGKRVAVFGASVMQIHSGSGRALARLIFRLADLIAIREPWSIQTIRGFGVTKKIFHTMEPGIVLQKSDEQRVAEIMKENFIAKEPGRPLIGIVVRNIKSSHKKQVEHYRAFSSEDIEKLKDSVAYVADHLNRIGRVVFLPMNTAGFDNDLEISKAVFHRMKNREGVVILDRDYTAREMMGLISMFEFMVVNRFHAMIFSAATNVPFVSIAYDFKFHGMARRLGMKGYNVDMAGLDRDILLNSVRQAWKNRCEIKDILRERLEYLKGVLDISVDLVVALGEKKEIKYENYREYFC